MVWTSLPPFDEPKDLAVEAIYENKDEDTDLSDHDATFSHDNSSSFGKASKSGPLDFADLWHLDRMSNSFGAPTQVTAKDCKTKVTCACGHPRGDCKHHDTKHT